MILIIKFISAALIGMISKIKMKENSLRDYAKNGNFIFPDGFMGFVKNEQKAITWTFLAMCLFALFSYTGSIHMIANSSNTPEPFLFGWIVIARRDVVEGAWIIIYATVAFMGQDFLLTGLGRTSKEMKQGIDWKTTKSDTEDGTLDAPTPMAPPAQPKS